MKRRQQIINYYRQLHNNDLESVEQCPMYDHYLWPYRLKEKEKINNNIQRDDNTITGFDFRVDESLSIKKAISKTCEDCAGSIQKVKNCQFSSCALFCVRD